MRLIGIRRIPSLAAFNSGKQCFVVHTKRFSRFSPLRKPGNLLVVGRPQSPGKGRLRCLANAPQVERLRALAGAEYGDALLAGKKVVSLWLEKRTAAPSGAIEKAAGSGLFPGFGSQDPTSVLQECIYSCPACHNCFGGIRIPAEHENSSDVRKHTSHAGATGCAERWKLVFRDSG